MWSLTMLTFYYCYQTDPDGLSPEYPYHWNTFMRRRLAVCYHIVYVIDLPLYKNFTLSKFHYSLIHCALMLDFKTAK
jgi:hypothetical protein